MNVVTPRVRNVDADLTLPVERWPYEALVSVIERGLVHDWLPIIRAIRNEPWGAVARQVEHYLGYAQPYGVAPMLRHVIDRARAAMAQREREIVADRVQRLMTASGLTTAEFAARVGTSRSRLSTYRSGTVTPSAALIVRMERVAASASHERSDPTITPAP